MQPFHMLSTIKLEKKEIVLAQNLSNTEVLGRHLYTDYVYPFELIGVLLLIAIIATISLNVVTHQKKNHKRINKRDQINIQREDRIKLIKTNQ